MPNQWKPISQAPAGRSFLGWSERGGVNECCLHYGKPMPVVAAVMMTKLGAASYSPPTHFMFLPEPPNIEG